MANYITQFSVLFDPGEGNLDKAMAMYKIMTKETYDPGGEGPVNFDLEVQDGKLWICDGGYDDSEGVIRYVLECARRFELTGKWGFTYANTCSSPRTDGFGGGAVVIDLGTKAVDVFDAAIYLAAQLAPDPDPDYDDQGNLKPGIEHGNIWHGATRG
jgi:hypothetical protein